MLILLYSFLIGLIGLIGHWAKKFARKQTTDNIFTHFKENLPHTIGSLGCLLFATTTIVSVGVNLEDVKDLATLILAGYSSDSLMNKNSDQ